MPSIPIRWSPRPVRAALRTRTARQLADRAFAVAVLAALVGSWRLLDLLDTIAPISAGAIR